MEEKDKKDLNQDQKLEIWDTLVDRGGNLFGAITAGTGEKPPKRYICPNCGIILGPDLLWKKEGNIRKPFCSKCKVLAKEENKTI